MYNLGLGLEFDFILDSLFNRHFFLFIFHFCLFWRENLQNKVIVLCQGPNCNLKTATSLQYLQDYKGQLGKDSIQWKREIWAAFKIKKQSSKVVPQAADTVCPKT